MTAWVRPFSGLIWQPRETTQHLLGPSWATFRPTKFKIHYIAPQFFIFWRTVQIAPNFLHWHVNIFLFGLILRDIPNSITPQTTLRLLPIPVGLLVLPCICQCWGPPLLPSPPPFFFSLSQTEELAKAGTCARDTRTLQQLALNVHVKHSDLTCPNSNSATIQIRSPDSHILI